MKTKWPTVRLGQVLQLFNSSVPSSQLTEINLAGVYSFGRGLFKRGPMFPSETSYKTYNRLFTDDFVISQPKAWEGALARVTPEFEGWYLSPVFPTFRVLHERLEPKFLEWFCKRVAERGREGTFVQNVHRRRTALKKNLETRFLIDRQL